MTYLIGIWLLAEGIICCMVIGSEEVNLDIELQKVPAGVFNGCPYLG